MGNKLKYSSNEFVSQTKDSNDKALRLATFHTSMLKLYSVEYPDDPDYTFMYDRMSPLTEDALEIFATVDSIIDAQVGQTELVNIHLKAIKGKKGLARDWYNRTAAIYALKNPARMTAIFSQGLKPFDETKDKIISSLNTLSMNIGDDTNVLMIAIKDEVDAEYEIVNPDRKTQLMDMGATEKMYKNLKKACKLAMRMEYRNAAKIMDKFDENIDDIQESFHDMELLISKQQSKWDIGIAPLATKYIAQRTQIALGKFRAKVIGGNAIMYLASKPGGTDSDFVILLDGIENKFTAAAFKVSDYGLNRHITVVNDSNKPIRLKLFLG